MERLGAPAKRALAKVAAKTVSPATPSPGLALAARRTADGLPVIYDDICDRAIPEAVLVSWREHGKPQEIRRLLTARERPTMDNRTGSREAIRASAVEALSEKVFMIFCGTDQSTRGERALSSTD